MQASDIPSKSGKIWGVSASGTYIRTVPQTTSDPAAASFDLGFPPQTFTDEGAGGTPPDGRDFNGVLNFLTAWARWQQSGAPLTYDAAFQTAIGGYPKGAAVQSAVTFGLFWQSTVDNNTTNPDAAGAGWRRFALSGGLLNVQVFTASGTYTPTAGTQSIEVIVVGGGGAGGGSQAMGGSGFGAAGGGGSGGWASSRLTSSFAGLAVTVGGGGAGGAGVPGASGGTSSFAGMTCQGGTGGAFGAAFANATCQIGGGGGPSSGGSLYSAFGTAGTGAVALTSGNQFSGSGGSTPWGGGGAGAGTATSAGNNGSGYGAGGGGAIGQTGAGALSGGNGANGVVIIREFA